VIHTVLLPMHWAIYIYNSVQLTLVRIGFTRFLHRIHQFPLSTLVVSGCTYRPFRGFLNGLPPCSRALHFELFSLSVTVVGLGDSMSAARIVGVGVFTSLYCWERKCCWDDEKQFLLPLLLRLLFSSSLLFVFFLYPYVCIISLLSFFLSSVP
jgi:hypothetical protein